MTPLPFEYSSAIPIPSPKRTRLPIPAGCWEDTRYCYARGAKVRVTECPYEGHVATMNSCVGQVHAGGEMVLEPGYQVTLDDDRKVTVRWDRVSADE